MTATTVFTFFIPALSLPAIAEPIDPIFAAIERHRLAEATAEAAAPDDLMIELVDKVAEAYADLLSMTPATREGAIALLLYVTQNENKTKTNTNRGPIIGASDSARRGMISCRVSLPCSAITATR